MSASISIALLAALLLPATGAQDKPPRYIGAFSEEQVLEHSERYADSTFIYIPDAEALEVFQAVTQPLTIKVFYRTDCIDSIRHVPPFIKTVRLADNDAIAVEYIGVSRAKDKPADLLAGWDIRRVPTFIVLREGEELGRVIETPRVKIEVDLAEILKPLAN